MLTNELGQIVQRIELSDSALPLEIATDLKDTNEGYVAWVELDGIHLAQIERGGNLASERIVDAKIPNARVMNLVVDVAEDGDVALAWGDRSNARTVSYWHYFDVGSNQTFEGVLPEGGGTSGLLNPRIEVAIPEAQSLLVDVGTTQFLVSATSGDFLEGPAGVVFSGNVSASTRVVDEELQLVVTESLNGISVTSTVVIAESNSFSFIDHGFADDDTITVSWVDNERDLLWTRDYEIASDSLGVPQTLAVADFGNNFRVVRTSFDGGQVSLRLSELDDDNDDGFQRDSNEDDGNVGEIQAAVYLGSQGVSEFFSLLDLAEDLQEFQNEPNPYVEGRVPRPEEIVAKDVAISSNSKFFALASTTGREDLDFREFGASVDFLLASRDEKPAIGVAGLSNELGAALSLASPDFGNGNDRLISIDTSEAGLINGIGPFLESAPVVYGDFQGDGNDRPAVFFRASGDWVTADNSLQLDVWTSPGNTWSDEGVWRDIMVADVDGDGLDDIIGRNQSEGELGNLTGEWYLARSTGDDFEVHKLGSWSNKVTWLDVVVGDFNGDGKDDIAGRTAQTGEWSVSSVIESGDGEFRIQTNVWGSWDPAIKWFDLQVGDFNADGLSDVVARSGTTGELQVGLSSGSSFSSTVQTQWPIDVSWQAVLVGEFDGQAGDDLAGLTEAGTWFVSASDGSTLTSPLEWGSWDPAGKWDNVFATDTNGDGISEILGLNSLPSTVDGVEKFEWKIADSTLSSFESATAGYWDAVDEEGNAVEWRNVATVTADADIVDFEVSPTSPQESNSSSLESHVLGFVSLSENARSLVAAPSGTDGIAIAYYDTSTQQVRLDTFNGNGAPIYSRVVASTGNPGIIAIDSNERGDILVVGLRDSAEDNSTMATTSGYYYWLAESGTLRTGDLPGQVRIGSGIDAAISPNGSKGFVSFQQPFGSTGSSQVMFDIDAANLIVAQEDTSLFPAARLFAPGDDSVYLAFDEDVPSGDPVFGTGEIRTRVKRYSNGVLSNSALTSGRLAAYELIGVIDADTGLIRTGGLVNRTLEYLSFSDSKRQVLGQSFVDDLFVRGGELAFLRAGTVDAALLSVKGDMVNEYPIISTLGAGTPVQVITNGNRNFLIRRSSSGEFELIIARTTQPSESLEGNVLTGISPQLGALANFTDFTAIADPTKPFLQELDLGDDAALFRGFGPLVDSLQVLYGDFNGDFIDEPAIFLRPSGDWIVGELGTGDDVLSLNTWTGPGNSFNDEGVWRDFLVLDIDGDGRDDILARNQAEPIRSARSSNVLAAPSIASNSADINGDGNVGFTDFLILSGSFGMQDASPADGDIDRDGAVGFSDFLQLSSEFGPTTAAADFVDTTQGTWYLARATEDGQFEVSRPGAWNNETIWYDVQSGDFNGDGLDDVAGRSESTGEWRVSLAQEDSLGAVELANQDWGSWDVNEDWFDVLVGDFNGDGFDDVAGRSTDGIVQVGFSDGTTFTDPVEWADWTFTDSWKSTLVGNFNGDSIDDLAFQSEGQWWVSLGTASNQADTPSLWGNWPADADWQNVQVADLDADGISDIVGRNNDPVGAGIGAKYEWYGAISDGSSAFQSRSLGFWDAADDDGEPATWSHVSVIRANASVAPEAFLNRASSTANEPFSLEVVDGVVFATPKASDTAVELVLGNVTHTLQIAGEEFEFDASEVDVFRLDGAGLEIPVVVHGTDANDQASILDQNGELVSDNYQVFVTSFKDIQFFGGGGKDGAQVYGSLEGDVLTSFPQDVTLTTPLGTQSVAQFERVDAFGRGGEDSASVYGSQDPDEFWTFADFEVLTGTNHKTTTKGFERVDAFGRGGDDQAYLNDTPDDDQFWSFPDYSVLVSPNRRVVTKGFETTQAESTTGGNDSFFLRELASEEDVSLMNGTYDVTGGRNVSVIGYTNYDGPELDDASPEISLQFGGTQYLPTSTNGRLTFVDSTGEAVDLPISVSREQDAVTIVLTTGDDTATLQAGSREHRFDFAGFQFAFSSDLIKNIYLGGAQGNNQISIIGTEGDDVAQVLNGVGELSGSDYLVQTFSFDQIEFSGAGGFDTIDLYGTDNNDLLDADGAIAVLTSADKRYAATGFERIDIFGRLGSDQATLTGTKGDDTLYRFADYLVFFADNSQLVMKGFSTTVVDADAGGSDTAYLLELTSRDNLMANASELNLTNPDESLQLVDFERVIAARVAGEDPGIDIGVIDFILESEEDGWL